MSRPTVIGVGMDEPGQPAFINWRNSRSLTRCIGRLLSAHHLARWALNGDGLLEKYLASKNKYIPCFVSRMCTMANRHWGLTKSGEWRKYWAIRRTTGRFIESCINCIGSKATDHVGLQVWGGCMTFESWYRRTPPALFLQCLAAHLKKWYLRSPSVPISTSLLKKP